MFRKGEKSVVFFKLRGVLLAKQGFLVRERISYHWAVSFDCLRVGASASRHGIVRGNLIKLSRRAKRSWLLER